MNITPRSHQYIPTTMSTIRITHSHQYNSRLNKVPQSHQSPPRMKNFQWSQAQSLKQFLATHVRPSNPPSDEVDCPICIQPWHSNIQEVIQANCGHTMHRICLVSWLTHATSPNTCPYCRHVFFPGASPPSRPSPVPGTNIVVNDKGEWVPIPMSETLFYRMEAHVKRLIAPLLDVDEIREQCDIDLHSSRQSRFIRAVHKIATAGVGLLRFPSNLQEGEMGLLKHHLVDWLTIKFHIATLFIQAHRKLMQPKHWIGVLASRDRMYRATVHSRDFGAVKQGFLSNIIDFHALEYGITIDEQWPGSQFPSVCWQEFGEKGNLIYSVQHDYKVVRSSLPFFVGFSNASSSPKPRLYFEYGSLYVWERELGSIADFSIDQAARTVVVRSAAGQMLKVQFVDNLRVLGP